MIYIVTTGSYGDYEVLTASRQQDLAEAYVEQYNRDTPEMYHARVEEFVELT